MLESLLEVKVPALFRLPAALFNDTGLLLPDTGADLDSGALNRCEVGGERGPWPIVGVGGVTTVIGVPIVFGGVKGEVTMVLTGLIVEPSFGVDGGSVLLFS